jgi:hypothetical protein
VPQFQLLYQPVLIAFAAGLALVAARSLLGRWGAFQALGMFFFIRGVRALCLGVVAGYTTPHFPLYVAEAAVVEVAALAAPRAPLRFALLAGAGIGTVGLAAEWGWSHVWMPHPWPASMLVAAVVLAIVAALAASAVLGARLSQSPPCRAPSAALPGLPRAAVAVAGVAALVALFVPLPRTGGDGTRAAIAPTPPAAGRRTSPCASTRPMRARQPVVSRSSRGRAGRRPDAPVDAVATGRRWALRDPRPVPVTGNWKSMVRRAMRPAPDGHRRLPAPGAAVRARRLRCARGRARCRPTPSLLQREATGGPRWLTTTAYAVLGVVVAVWLGLLAWALGLAEPRRQARQRATVASTWQPPVAPA